MQEKIVFIQTSALLNGNLRYSTMDPEVEKLFRWDSLGTLKNRDHISQFDKTAAKNNVTLKFEDEATEARYRALLACSNDKYEVRSPFLEDHELFPFQHIGLNYTWEQLHTDSPRVLVQWDTGAGKTLLSCLTSQKLMDNDDIDLVLVFCKKIKQHDWEQEFNRMTYLSVTRITDKLTRKKRHDLYLNNTSQVVILNYEKVREGNLTKVKG